MRVAAVGGGVPDAPRRLAAAEGGGGVKTPPYDAKINGWQRQGRGPGMPGPYGIW